VIVGTNGELVLPAEMRKTLGIRAGTPILVTREDNRIILEPVNKA
jgi:AbrB family looped-hinge helix DNA binding protein